MDTAYKLVAVATSLVAVAFYVWYAWRFFGADIRAWWDAVVGPWVERERELAAIRRMWAVDA